MTEDEQNTDAEHDAGRWRVIIEETSGFGDSQHWKITKVQPCVDGAEARHVALTHAESYQPEHPRKPQSRSIYQIGSDTWLVRLTGRVRDYHFRISAGRLIGGSDT